MCWGCGPAVKGLLCQMVTSHPPGPGRSECQVPARGVCNKGGPAPNSARVSGSSSCCPTACRAGPCPRSPCAPAGPEVDGAAVHPESARSFRGSLGSVWSRPRPAPHSGQGGGRVGQQRPAFPRAREKLSFLSSQAPDAPCSSGWEGPGPTGDRARCPYHGDILCLCPRPWEGCGDHLGAAPAERPGHHGCLASGPGGPLATGRGRAGREQQNPSGALHLNAESKGASWRRQVGYHRG